jgi:type IV secretory pathway VirB6-like protein
MPADLYPDFLASDDTLRIYTGGMLAFTSKKDRLLPLLDYLAAYGAICQTVTIYDKVIGNAAALLAIRANASGVYSPLGSELAVKTLQSAASSTASIKPSRTSSATTARHVPDGRTIPRQNAGRVLQSDASADWEGLNGENKARQDRHDGNALGIRGIPIQRLSEDDAVTVIALPRPGS